MGGLAGLGPPVDLGEKVVWSDVSFRCIARCAAMDDAAGAGSADDGDGGSGGMRAALGAARDMHERQRRRQMRRELGSNGARRDQPGGASGRTGTGNDAAARIARVDDEAELRRRMSYRNGARFAQRSKQ